MPSLVALNRARQAVRDADAAIAASRDWHTAHSYVVQREEHEREARRRAAVAAMHDRYAAKRAAKKAAEAVAAVKRAAKKAAPAAPPDSGKGWRVLPGPTPHADLEQFVKQVDDLAFMSLPWPDGWRVRWGELDPNLFTPRSVTLGCCVREAKVIIIDRRHVTRGTAADFTETILHELAHMRSRPGEAHGPAFARTLGRVRQYFASLAAPPHPAPEPAPPTAPPGAGRPHPEVVTGRRWGPQGWIAQPGLAPDLEYRG
jgi:hypothetical protein